MTNIELTGSCRNDIPGSSKTSALLTQAIDMTICLKSDINSIDA